MKNHPDTKRELGESFRRIIDSASTKEAEDPINTVSHLLSRAGGHIPHNYDYPTTLENGQLAIAPSSAAGCIFDYERTRQFVRGLNMAITEARNRFRGEIIQVLDAGCGPYATLAVSQCFAFSPDEARFTLMDIHEASVNAARAVVRTFGLERHCSKIIKDDATKHKCSIKPHVVVTENMIYALFKEPQAAITTNLAPQMRRGGIFVPEEVALDVYGHEPPSQGFPRGQKRLLGPAFRLTKDTPAGAGIDAEIVLPEIRPVETVLLQTRVRVFGDAVIESGTAYITKPFMVTSFIAEHAAGCRIKLEYKPGDACLKYAMRGGDRPWGKAYVVAPREVSWP